jgi:multiple sugar transport system permease protein
LAQSWYGWRGISRWRRADSWQVLVRIFLPALVPAVVTVALFAFVMSWNEFLGALAMINNDESYTK